MFCIAEIGQQFFPELLMNPETCASGVFSFVLFVSLEWKALPTLTAESLFPPPPHLCLTSSGSTWACPLKYVFWLIIR